MKVELKNNKDFLAGLLLLSFGCIGFYLALDYPFGSALRMGPGYFPRVLSGILIAFGVVRPDPRHPQVRKSKGPMGLEAARVHYRFARCVRLR